MNTLLNISPIDGRYQSKTESLQQYFSEWALQKYRIQVEVEYFISLCETKQKNLEPLSDSDQETLRAIYTNFSTEDGVWIKKTEKTTNHDVKAVEYFIKEKIKGTSLEAKAEFIHFALTSQDINNTATPMMMRDATAHVVVPQLNQVIARMQELVAEYRDIPMLARTHGQPASPTRLGKEIEVFVVRLQRQLAKLVSLQYFAKFGGATGNFNAHAIAYPEYDWKSFGTSFVEDTLGLSYSFPTTQIEHYDGIAEWCHVLIRINTILIDFDRDMWTYISQEYFGQKIIKGEIGSSAMPHKVNPIDFENSEGNLMYANSIFEFLARKLPISRLQRDLTDSTVLRNIGVPVAHSVIAYTSTIKGISKLKVRADVMQADLEKNWAVVAEAIQNILRREQVENPYEKLLELTRGKVINKESIHAFINNLDVTDAIRAELLLITPQNYLGL